MIYIYFVGGIRGGLKYSLVAWDKVCSPVDASGLGFRRILYFKFLFMAKGYCHQIWRTRWGGIRA